MQRDGTHQRLSCVLRVNESYFPPQNRLLGGFESENAYLRSIGIKTMGGINPRCEESASRVAIMCLSQQGSLPSTLV